MNSYTAVFATSAVVAAVFLAACGSTPSSTQQTQSQPSTKAETTAAAGAVHLNGSGATFPQPLYEDWAFAFKQTDPTVLINYSGGGSGQGKKDIIAGIVDFAGSDSKLTDEEFAKKPMQQIPMVAGAVVLAYNLAGLKEPLVLDADTVAGIYVGTIQKWNDLTIAKLNPGVALPDWPINVVHRSDGSGTTNIFTLYLTAVSDAWKSAVNPSAGTTVDWPVDKLKRGQGGKGNPGVAAAVQKTRGAIGYIELAYAVNNKIPFAKLINAAGRTVQASPASTTAAMQDAKFSDRLTADIVNSAQPKAWPIAGFTYLILNTDYPDCQKAEKLAKWIQWSLRSKAAQDHASKLLYAPLLSEVSSKAQAALNAITCKGSPALK